MVDSGDVYSLYIGAPQKSEQIYPLETYGPHLSLLEGITVNRSQMTRVTELKERDAGPEV